MTSPENQPKTTRFPAEREFELAVEITVGNAGKEDWPPVSYADNDRILVWWLPEYDDLLRQLVEEYQWAWQPQAHERLEAVVPAEVLYAWRDADPLCAKWSWYNVLGVFAAARTKHLGIRPRPPQRLNCPCCSREFLQSEVPHPLVMRLGVNAVDICGTCLKQALYDNGSTVSTEESVIAVLRALSAALGRPPKRGDLSGRVELGQLTAGARAAVVRALRVKPAASRVVELFGSWAAAVARAQGAPAVSPPAGGPAPAAGPAVRAGAEFPSSDPARYRAATGSLPEMNLDPGRDPWEYAEEIGSLIGTGYLALAEAALAKLEVTEPGLPAGYLADLYAQTARFAEAQAVIDRFYGEGSPREQKARDLRTISAGPVFYEPLPTPPRGRVRFVLVGGPMDYVDRRGEHACVSGEADSSGAPAISEDVARVNAMVDSDAWIRVAAKTGHTVMASLARAGSGPRPYGHLVSYVTGPFRDAVKAVTGALPKKLPEDAWHVGPSGKSGWSYQRDAGQFVFNARADFSLITVDAPPAVAVWGWPDRSDLCLQAFTDTIASGTADPVTVILPDVPTFRDFARRYVRGGRMDRVGRTLMEERLYRAPSGASTKRGTVLSAEFAPRLVVHPDGTEDSGTALAGALAYLDASHTLRLSVWDVLADSLLRDVAAVTPAVPKPFSVPAYERSDMIRWYAQYPDADNVTALLSPYRPSLLEARA